MEKIQKIQKEMKESFCGGILVESPEDLLYLTDLSLSCGTCFLFPDHFTLFVDGRYFEKVKETFPLVQLSQKENLEEYFKTLKGKKLIFDSAFTSYESFEKWTKKSQEWDFELEPLASPLKEWRMRKTSHEIEEIEKGCQLTIQGFEYGKSCLKEGITEIELARKIKIFWLEHGGSGEAFGINVSFGPHSACPHHSPTHTPLKKNQVVLIDLGVKWGNYCSDMTRVVFFGRDQEIEKVYEIVLEGQKRALEGCKQGVKCGDVDALARDYITSQGYGNEFSHGLGHGVGLEIHENPYLRKDSEQILQEGMVVTIEPGIYLPGVGGVRIEDTIVITESGYRNLTPLSKKRETIS